VTVESARKVLVPLLNLMVPAGSVVKVPEKLPVVPWLKMKTPLMDWTVPDASFVIETMEKRSLANVELVNELPERREDSL
jgi:hypothetical protein